jgi:hypothetical protein
MPGTVAESSLSQMEKYFDFQKEVFKGFSSGKISRVASADASKIFSKDFSQIDFKPDKQSSEFDKGA